MKKSVVILIAIIYVTSIALVSFFGLAYKVFNEVIDVQSIELLNEGLKDSGDPEKGYYAIIQKNENGEWKYQIKYRVHPDNATNTKVDFSYNKNQTIATVDEESGVVTFNRVGTITITLLPNDRSDCEAKITLIAV